MMPENKAKPKSLTGSTTRSTSLEKIKTGLNVYREKKPKDYIQN